MNTKRKSIKRSSKKLSVCTQENKLNSSYEKDFYKWTQVQATLLKKKNFSELDLENIIEEIETLGRSDKRKLYSFLVVLLQHLLKNIYMPLDKGNSRSWDATIFNSRKGIQNLLKDSPSLKPILKTMLEDAYNEARDLALIETNKIYKDEEIFPLECPWSLEEVIQSKRTQVQA